MRPDSRHMVSLCSSSGKLLSTISPSTYSRSRSSKLVRRYSSIEIAVFVLISISGILTENFGSRNAEFEFRNFERIDFPQYTLLVNVELAGLRIDQPQMPHAPLPILFELGDQFVLPVVGR